MPGKSATSLAANYIGKAMARNKGTIAAASIGAGVGIIGGAVWDYEGRGMQGAMAGAGLAMAARGGIGAMRMGFSGAKSALGTMAKQGHVVSNMAIGAGIGGFTGPSDSTVANMGFGAMAGATGGVLGARLGSRIGNRFAINSKNMYVGHNLGAAGRGPNLTMGKLGARKGSMIDKFSIQGRSLSTAHIGGTATALFAPAAAHALIGGSRRDKSMNQFNKY